MPSRRMPATLSRCRPEPSSRNRRWPNRPDGAPGGTGLSAAFPPPPAFLSPGAIGALGCCKIVRTFAAGKEPPHRESGRCSSRIAVDSPGDSPRSRSAGSTWLAVTQRGTRCPGPRGVASLRQKPIRRTRHGESWHSSDALWSVSVGCTRCPTCLDKVSVECCPTTTWKIYVRSSRVRTAR